MAGTPVEYPETCAYKARAGQHAADRPNEKGRTVKLTRHDATHATADCDACGHQVAFGMDRSQAVCIRCHTLYRIIDGAPRQVGRVVMYPDYSLSRSHPFPRIR